MDTFIYYLSSILAVIFVLCPHEWGHAFAATKCGDGTAKANGRLTLNPIKHLDPLGFVCCALVGFGWAKPVPINPYNFKNYRKGLFLTAIAGVLVNYLIAFVVYLLYVLFVRFALAEMLTLGAFMSYLGELIFYTLLNIYSFSLAVFVFNLLPLYPLDGFRVVESCTRQINPVRRFLRNYGQMILIILIAESFICDILSDYVEWAKYCDILGYVMYFATDIIGYPMKLAWDWILKL